MACHQHRCCGGPTTAATGGEAAPDYVLLAADDAAAVEAASKLLRGTGASIERHDLGLRLNCRSTNWRTALDHLCAALSPAARGSVRVALIAIGADALAFQKALLTSQPLDAFMRGLRIPVAGSCTSTDGHFLGDVFKGESLD